ncbi:MAG TPA: hypothetical protein PK847_11935 [Candidatus Sumerlaeota bacterium]|nr:hypothetical protein [Candidatus Sumerlaeota bacterium]HOR28369.1 hypothetical protein [Candidatus Sumerlaeota bacterium]
MKRWEKLTLALLVALSCILLVGPGLWAQTAGKYYRTERTNTRYVGDTFQTAGSEHAWAYVDVAVTSPTVTISANARRAITVTADANQTGYRLIDGEVGQVVVIRTGAGFNTLRFDDGASQSLGADITLTEGQNDVLALQCINAEGDEWIRLWSSDN